MQAFAKENLSMYTPRAFAIEDLSQLHELILATRLAILVSHGENGLQASHVPVLLHREQGEYGTLYGHLAKANPQWKDLRDGAEAMLIFAGPDAYVSPGFYPSKAEHGKPCRPGTTSPCTPTARPRPSVMAAGCSTLSAP
jgi:transcriptional regulator